MKQKLKINIKKSTVYLLSALLIIVMGVIIFNILNFAKKEIVTYKTTKNQEIYFYLGEAKYEYSSNITLSSENEVIKFTTKGYEHSFDSEPIYFKNKEEVLLPNDMSVVFPKNNFVQNRINKFSRITKDGTYIIRNSDLNYPVENAFLYDGNDLYFFLNKTEIKIGDFKYELSPFSYAIYNYNKELYMYDYEDDKMVYFEAIDEPVFAMNDDYIINLEIDGIVYTGKSKLLMKNFDYLKKLK